MRPDSQLVCLRALDDGDIECTLKWHNDSDLYRSLVSHFRHVSRQTEQEWLRQRMSSSPREVNLAICLVSTGEHVGNIYLRDIDWVSKNAALGVFLGEHSCRGKGYGSQALTLILRHAFEDLGLHRIYLFALAENEAALAAYRKVGFSKEGTLRQHVFKKGSFRDMVVLGIHADEWAGYE